MSERASPRPLVLDSSVAVKWYLPEELRDEALELSARMGAGDVELSAPSTIGPEVFNALSQQHRRGNLSLDEVRQFFVSFDEAPISLFEIDSLVSRACGISLETGVIVYDSLFLALAEETDTVMVTADDKLMTADFGGIDPPKPAHALRVASRSSARFARQLLSPSAFCFLLKC